MANQYPGPPPEQPPGQSGQSGQSGQNPYAAPPGGPYAEGAYGYPTVAGSTPSTVTRKPPLSSRSRTRNSNPNQPSPRPC